MTQWFRLWHGTASDPKLAAAAARAKVSRAEALAVWVSLLEHASQNDPRGQIGDPAEDIAVALAMEIGTVEAVIGALEGKGLIVGQRIAAWDRRQPKREDAHATERWRRWKQKSNAPQTQNEVEKSVGDASQTPQSRAEQSRAEKTRAREAEKLPEGDPAVATGERSEFVGACPPGDFDRMLAELGAIVDDLPDKAREVVTSLTRQAVAGRLLTDRQRETLASIHAEHQPALAAEATRRFDRRFPDWREGMGHPQHGPAVARAVSRYDAPELDRLLVLIRDDITNPPAFLRRRSAA